MKQVDQSKKAYSTPALRVYGDIREITQNVGAAGANDGGVIVGQMMTH